MGVARTIQPDEREAAISAAITHAKFQIGTERGFVSPKARLDALSDYEWRKIAEGVISGWIVERSRQVVAERIGDDAQLLATGEIPEPQELGVCALVLKPLGDVVQAMQLSDQPIGNWKKDEILLFVWTVTELVNDARAARDERPGPAVIVVGGELAA